MEATNEERRRVAKKLLEIIWCMRKREEFYKSGVDPTRCGNVTYRNIAGSVEESGNLIKGNYINIVERLADLIDRPTCERVECDQHYWRCSRCGVFVYWDAVANLTGVVPTRYCPNCGAMITEKEEDDDQ